MDTLETGYCIVCGQNSTFRFDPTKISAQLKQAWTVSDGLTEAFNRRESMYCSNCGSSLRIRRLCSALIQTFSEITGKACKSFVELLSEEQFRSMRIAEINVCGTLHNYLKQHPNLYYSEYIPDVPSGSEYNGVRCEDLQHLTYPNDYFDFVLTSDTLEHVPDFEKAFNEIYRALKPGGFHLFTVPVIPSQGATIRRARLVDGEHQLLLDPVYHGPWEREDVLVFTDFGMDIAHKLEVTGFATDVLFLDTDDELDVAFVFRSRKAGQVPPAMRTGRYPVLEWTGERFLPWIEGAQPHYEHLHRYAFATHFVKGKKVLDLACGEGYGTYMLAREAEYVAGVEIDESTVQHAGSRYIKDNLEFIEGSILDVPIEGERKFDVIVCFEGIEHIAEHDKLLSEVKRLLKDDGLFIVSTPNKAVYTDARDHHSNFHVKELYFEEFSSLLRRYFKHLRIFGQRTYAGSNMWSIHERKSPVYIEEVVNKGDMEFYFAERTSKEPLFYIGLASNGSLEPLTCITDSWLTDASNEFFNDYERQVFELRTKAAKLSSLETSLGQKVAQTYRLESQIRRLEYQIHHLEYQIHHLKYQLYQLQHSIVMQLVNRYQGFVEKLMRTGTRRRDYYELGLAGIRVILNEGWRSFFRQAWDRLVHRPAAIRKPRHDLPKFNASISEKEADKLVFPMLSEKPEVSIVIPVYNQLAYTLNCLKSIAENTAGDYEVVVIDDASTDETSRVLSKVKNLRLVTNEQNMGFIESGNRGARTSKGEKILFLNNDTMVTKDWLPPLLEVIKREDVGAVGSMLVYPDGTLQEAGSIVWNDGSARNYGRGDDPDKPEYNYVREVDYCPGACFLVKRDLFEKMGGFDERYKPAYKEIVDLCFSIRSLGYKVMHQPMSVVVHFEGVTGGRDIHAGIKKYQEINRPKFVEKWCSVLQKDHYAPDARNIFLAREKISGKRMKRIILIIDDKVPDYDRYAGALGMYQYTKLFVDLGFKVIFLPADLRRTESYTSEMQQYGIEVIYGRFNLDSWLSKNGKHINYVWLSRPEVAIRYIDKIRGHTSAKILYCGRDLHYLRWLRKYEVERSEQALKVSQRLKETEFLLFNSADAILTFSTFEAATISKDLPEKRNIYIIPPYLYDELPFEGFPSDYVLPPFDDRKDIAFLGGFGHSPNADAVIWFIKECFPHIVAQLPDMKLFVIGSDPPKDIMDLQSENIVVTGYVKDLKQYFQKIKLCVAPVRWGAGVKGKIVTSMYYGVPVVTTSLGAEGMSLTDGEHVLIADTPESLAAKVVELYSSRDIWEKLSKNSLQYVKERFSKKAALEKLLPILDVPQCYICGALYKLPDPQTVTNFRETRLCPKCGASKRKSDLARVVLKVIGSDASCLSEANDDLRELKIYLLESRGPIHAVLSNSPNLMCSEYWNDVSPGDTRGKVRCEDVQNLTFPDASFDIVITQDVFEHVPNAEAGFKEIHRVLKPGGYHIFTVPFDRRLACSVARARVEGKEIMHLLPAVYHGDSLRYGGCLVFTDFGPDLIGMLERVGFEVGTYEDERPEYVNGYNIVFACRKV